MPSWFSRDGLVAIGVVAALVASGAAACVTKAAPGAATTTAAPPATAAMPPFRMIDDIVDVTLKRVAVPSDGPGRGARAAKVTIVEFGDFECPFSARVELTLLRLVREHPDDVRIVFRHLPLAFHPNAALAAQAAVAADAQGKFWEMHDKLFDNQSVLDRASLERYAAALGLDVIRFGAALDGGTAKAAVDADLAVAARLNVVGTPSFLINGRHIGGAQPYEEFARIVDDEIARADRLLARGVPAADLYATFLTHAGSSLPETSKRATPPGTEIYAVPAPDAPARGAAQPKVTIVEFADFECSYSARSSATLVQLLAEYPGDVQLIYRHQPLVFHLQAMPAALAAEAAREQGKFWAMHDRLFANQASLDSEDLERYAHDLGLNLAAFRRSMKERSGRPRVRRDLDLAARFGAAGTPYFFVNGRMFRGDQSIEVWKKLIDEEIQKADAELAAGTPRAQLYAALTGHGATESAQAPAPGKADKHESGTRYRVDVSGSPSRGAGDDALVTIVEWGDLHCPFCRRVEPTLAQLLSAHKGKVRLVWRDFPIAALHPRATAAALATRAAGHQGKFWEMHDRILASEEEQLDGAELEKHAEALRLDMTRFREEMAAPSAMGSIDADFTAGRKLAVRGTPSFFVNGRYVGGALPYKTFDQIIAQELRVAEALIARGTPRDQVYAELMKGAEPEVSQEPTGKPPTAIGPGARR